jgi:hypothetical protein
VNFLIADTFQKSLGRLTADEQAAVKQAAFDFQLNPKNPGFSYEGYLETKRLSHCWPPRRKYGLHAAR